MTDTLTIDPNANSSAASDADAAAIEKFDKAGEALNPKEASPAEPSRETPAPAEGELDVPDKFKGDDGDLDVAKLLKSYKELESARSKPADSDTADEPATPPSAVDGGEDQEDGEQAEEQAQVTTILDRAGVDMDAAQKAIIDTGDLTEEHYAALEKEGLPRTMVSQYVKGLKADASAYATKVQTAAGGEDAYNQMVTWASTEWDAKTRDNFNAAIQAGEEHAMPWIEYLKGQYTGANGTGTGNIQSGNGSRVDAGGRFDNYDQVTEAMRDPRYKKDAAYRAQVDAKLERSPI